MKIITKIPIEKIKRFITLQDEKIALRFELEKSSEEIARGAISKHEYRRRRKSVEMRISELNRTLANLKSELKASDPLPSEGQIAEELTKLRQNLKVFV